MILYPEDSMNLDKELTLFCNWPQITSGALKLKLNSIIKISEHSNPIKPGSTFLVFLMSSKKLFEGFFKNILEPCINVPTDEAEMAVPKFLLLSTGSNNIRKLLNFLSFSSLNKTLSTPITFLSSVKL